MALDLDFEWNSLRGQVRVECVANADPAAVGSLPGSEGLPVCTATIEYSGRGYRALFGWVQLVRSTDNRSHGANFEVDPFVLFTDTGSPYCWYGVTPTLFDAPARWERRPIRWTAHSFLATTPFERLLEGRFVVPVAGFSWGFEIVDGEPRIDPVMRLERDAWDQHVPVLRETYAGWSFEPAER